MSKKKEVKSIKVGTVRIKKKDLKAYEKTSMSWKRSTVDVPDALHVIDLFRAHGKFKALIDSKNPEFLKGQRSPDGMCQGARINILPDGRKLDKAYSLFAEHLTIHDETSNTHWDVIYRNPGGTYSYLYTLHKKAKFIKKKYREVEEFERRYPELMQNVHLALLDRNDNMAVPMFTILTTYMRIGNDIYYKASGHKGLTTLKKRDIEISGRAVTFTYLSKGGVPRKIAREFPDIYIKRLRSMLKPLKPSSFVFVNKSTGHPLSDSHFKAAFEKYCGKDFFPHIVRSYYATEKAKEFLSQHDTATKKEVLDLFRHIADVLGHKKFVKKEHAWKEGYNVTIHHYIQPEVLDKLNSLYK